MNCAWCRLLLVLVLLSCDGGSYCSEENYYVDYDQSVGENLNGAANNPKRATDTSVDRGRKRVQDNVQPETKTNRVNASAVSSKVRRLRSVENGFRNFRFLSPPNEFARVGTDEKRPPADVRQRVKSKRDVTPTYSISSDKYSVNISCHLAFRRSCALPDAAFIFKQLPLCEEETTTNSAATGDVMELLTFQESSCGQTDATAKLAHRSARDRHRVIGVDGDESKCIVKDALAFESSQVTKIWGEHGRAGPVVPGDAVSLHNEFLQNKNQRKRRSPHWTFPYKQVLSETDRLITKCKALSVAAKSGKFGSGLFFWKNEKDHPNGTDVIGQSKKCETRKCTPYPHKGHWCHYHHKYHQDRRTLFFRHNKTVKISKTTAHHHTSPTVCIKNQVKSNAELKLSTMTTKMIGAVTKKASLVDGVDGKPRRKADISSKSNKVKHDDEKEEKHGE